MTLPNEELATVQGREAVAGWFDAFFTLAIFTLYIAKASLMAYGLFALFFAVAIAVGFAAYYAYQEARLKGWEWKSTLKYRVEFAVFAIVLVAALMAALNATGLLSGGVISAATWGVIAPSIFIAALGIRALYNLGMLVYPFIERSDVPNESAGYRHLQEPEKSEKLIAENTAASKGYFPGFVIQGSLVVAAYFVLIAGSLKFAALGIAVAGFSVVYNIKSLIKPRFGGGADGAVVSRSSESIDSNPTLDSVHEDYQAPLPHWVTPSHRAAGVPSPPSGIGAVSPPSATAGVNGGSAIISTTSSRDRSGSTQNAGGRDYATFAGLQPPAGATAIQQALEEAATRDQVQRDDNGKALQA